MEARPRLVLILGPRRRRRRGLADDGGGGAGMLPGVDVRVEVRRTLGGRPSL